MSIEKDTGTILFYIMLSSLFSGIFTHVLLWPLLTFLTPKKLIKAYFRPPHFTLNEVDLYSSFPTSLFRTMIFGWAITLPFSAKKRKLEYCRKEMSLWFKVPLYLLCINTMIIFFIVFCIMLILEFVPTSN